MHFPEITSVSIDRGAVKTDLFNANGGGVFIQMLRLLVPLIMGRSVEDGIKNHLWERLGKE